MPGELYLVDSNVLIRWVKSDDPGYPVVAASIKRLAGAQDVACYVSQNLGEFWNVLTRPADKNGYGMLPEEADLRATDVEAAFRLLPDSLAVHIEWRKLLRDHRVSGIQVHDARLVAAMHVHGVKRILTFNTKDFDRYNDIEALNPLRLI
jgi:predicted nucleic acid-binding protein